MKSFLKPFETLFRPKPNETGYRTKKRYVLVMLANLAYGGFSILLFFFQVYSFFWMSEISGNGDLPRPNVGGGRMRDPFLFLSSPQNIVYLIGGIIAIVAGMALWQIMREKEIKSVKQVTAAKLLLPDEKAVVETLKRFNFELTQAKLANETGLNKVQVHRAVKRLETKGAIEKHGYGLTNKIILKKDFF
ncbi:MAG: hypothetical protein JW772_03415 [Candidatus Diapherotrites archaeon]|nr:hypothetical protein [Candidatus Diapherotrites archaeon]